MTTTFNRNRMEKSTISALARFQRGGIVNSLQTGGDGVRFVACCPYLEIIEAWLSGHFFSHLYCIWWTSYYLFIEICLLVANGPDPRVLQFRCLYLLFVVFGCWLEYLWKFVTRFPHSCFCVTLTDMPYRLETLQQK